MVLRELILAHRGLWSDPSEQNSLTSLLDAARLGFGVETDIRDANGQVVISHDPPRGHEPKLVELLQSISDLESKPTLALNVKSDGLAGLLRLDFPRDLPNGSFFFDMSAPEVARYRNARLSTALRVSEVEPMHNAVPLSRDKSGTIWLDALSSDWWVDLEAGDLVPDGWTIFVVSPELHARDPGRVWERLSERDWDDRRLGICTDFPVEFSEFMGRRVE